MIATRAGADRRLLILWLSVFVFLLLAFYLLSGILMPFIAAAVIAYFLNPLVGRLERWHVPRGLAAALTLLLFFALLGLIIVLVVPLFELQVTQLSRLAPRAVVFARERVQQLMEFAQQRLPPQELARARDIVGGWAGSAAGWGARLLEGLFTSGVALASLLSLLIVMPIVAFFLLRDWDRMVAHIDAALPRRHVAVIREQARLVDLTLAGMIHGQLLVCLSLGVYYAVALTVLGLKFAIVIGLLIGVLSFVPMLGAASGLLMALGLAAGQFGTWPMLVIVLAIFAVGQGVESNFLTPKLVGERVNLHPVWVIFALLAFGALFGFAGVLVALPMAAVIGVVVRFALGRYRASPLYESDGPYDTEGRPPGPP